jgi:hypothetical protein
MSRIDELKKQHPNYALSAIDIFKMMSPNQSSKYIEMLIKLDKDRRESSSNSEPSMRNQVIEIMVNWGIDYNYLETFDLETLWFVFNSMNYLMNESNIRLFNKFASYNERKLIENNDVTSYSSWDQIEQAVSLADVKQLDKKLEKEIKKVYEDDTWISLRPLSLEASMKYGANTKWCTTTESGQYYARYSSRGVLIYNINKKTGYKVACFKNLSPDHDTEFSWWDVTDKKIEVLDSEAPAAVLEAVRNEIKNYPCYNSHLMSENEQEKLHYYKEGIQQSQMHGLHTISDSRMHITGGFNWGTTTGTGTTLTTGGSGGIISAINSNGTTIDYNPSTWTTTADNVLRFSTTNNVGIGNINPTTQISVNGGNIEVNDGDIVFRTEGEERARLTPDGFRFSATQESLNEDLERRLFADLTREMNGGDRIADDAQQRLDDAMAEQMAEANERIAEKYNSLLENIELGTVEQQMVNRMQQLAGIQTREQRLAELDAERARIEQQARRNGEEAAEQARIEREALLEQINIDMAEQPVVPSTPKLNIWEQIKSLWSK